MLTDKVTPVYVPEELLRLRLTAVIDRKATEKLCLRLTFRSQSDAAIATSWSKPFVSSEPGRRELDFALPLSDFGGGKFYVSIGLYRVDELGRHFTLTHITRAFELEIQSLPVWDTNTHGYIALPDTEVWS